MKVINFSNVEIAQQINITPLSNCTNISDIINLYQEYWGLIIGDYDLVIISVITLEIMIILMAKDLYRRYIS